MMTYNMVKMILIVFLVPFMFHGEVAGRRRKMSKPEEIQTRNVVPRRFYGGIRDLEIEKRSGDSLNYDDDVDVRETFDEKDVKKDGECNHLFVERAAVKNSSCWCKAFDSSTTGVLDYLVHKCETEKMEDGSQAILVRDVLITDLYHSFHQGLSSIKLVSNKIITFRAVNFSPKGGKPDLFSVLILGKNEHLEFTPESFRLNHVPKGSASFILRWQGWGPSVYYGYFPLKQIHFENLEHREVNVSKFWMGNSSSDVKILYTGIFDYINFDFFQSGQRSDVPLYIYLDRVGGRRSKDELSLKFRFNETIPMQIKELLIRNSLARLVTLSLTSAQKIEHLRLDLWNVGMGSFVNKGFDNIAKINNIPISEPWRSYFKEIIEPLNGEKKIETFSSKARPKAAQDNKMKNQALKCRYFCSSEARKMYIQPSNIKSNCSENKSNSKDWSDVKEICAICVLNLGLKQKDVLETCNLDLKANRVYF